METGTTPQNSIFLSEMSSLIKNMSSYEEPELLYQLLFERELLKLWTKTTKELWKWRNG
jgi:hypothetical protein